MASLQERKFSDFRIVSRDKRSANEISRSCLQYVPYSSSNSAANNLPKLSDITNQEKRVYLREQQRERVIEVNNEDKGTLYSGFDSKRFLDLGVAPLQRIINELRSISAENADERHDHRAAKASGLVNYCEYLKGETASTTIRARK